MFEMFMVTIWHRESNSFASTKIERLACDHLSDLLWKLVINSEDTLKCQLRVCMVTRIHSTWNPGMLDCGYLLAVCQ